MSYVICRPAKLWQSKKELLKTTLLGKRLTQEVIWSIGSCLVTPLNHIAKVVQCFHLFIKSKSFTQYALVSSLCRPAFSREITVRMRRESQQSCLSLSCFVYTSQMPVCCRSLLAHRRRKLPLSFDHRHMLCPMEEDPHGSRQEVPLSTATPIASCHCTMDHVVSIRDDIFMPFSTYCDPTQFSTQLGHLTWEVNRLIGIPPKHCSI